MPKLGNCLEMYTCAQASAQSVHVLCTSLDTPCTLELLLGHTLYTRAIYCLGTPCTLHRYCLDTPCALELLLKHSLYTTQVLLGYSFAHYTGTTWVLLVHIQYNDLGTLSTLQGYCFGIPGTLYKATCLGIPCQQASTSLSTTCTLPEVVHLCLIIQNVIVNRQLRK